VESVRKRVEELKLLKRLDKLRDLVKTPEEQNLLHGCAHDPTKHAIVQILVDT